MAYWQFTDGHDVGRETLTDATMKEGSPKYIAVKHFFSAIRPGAVRVTADVSGTGASTLLASAYVHDADGTLTIVLVNTSASTVSPTIDVPSMPAGITSFDAWTSSDGSYWQPSSLDATGGQVTVPTPGYGVVTLVGHGAAMAGDAGAGVDGGGSGSDGGAGNEGGVALDGSAASADGGGVAHTDAGGCGCRVGAAPEPAFGVGLWAGVFMMVVWRRRRRARRAPRS